MKKKSGLGQDMIDSKAKAKKDIVAKQIGAKTKKTKAPYKGMAMDYFQKPDMAKMKAPAEITRKKVSVPKKIEKTKITTIATPKNNNVVMATRSTKTPLVKKSGKAYKKK